MRLNFLLIFGILLLICSCQAKQADIVTCELSIGDFREVIEAEGTIEAVNVITLVAPDYAFNSKISFLAKEGSFVNKGDTLCIFESPELLDLMESLMKSVDNVKGELTKLEADNALNMSMLMAQVEKNRAQMEIAQLDSIQMKFAPPIKQQLLALELEKAKVEEKKLEKKLTAQKLIDEQEVRQLKSRIIQEENRFQQYNDIINTLTLIAPSPGMVVYAESPEISVMMGGGGSGTFGGKAKVGGSVFPEMPVISLPDLSQVQVKLEVQEADFKRIEKDQNVTIFPSSVPGLVTTGKVKRKGNVGMRRQYESKVKLFEIIVSVDSCHNQLTQGLSALCEIIINEVKDTISVPSISVFEKDSFKVVYVKHDEMFDPVRVETGISSRSETIIGQGLSGNETIALTEPPFNLINKTKKLPNE